MWAPDIMAADEQPPSPSINDNGKAPRVMGDLRRRVLGWMLLVSLVPLVIMAAQGYHCAMQALVDRNGVMLANLVNERADALAAWTEETHSVVESLSNNESIRSRVEDIVRGESDNKNELRTYLDTVEAVHQDFDYVFVTDSQGLPLVYSSSGAPRYRDYFNNAYVHPESGWAYLQESRSLFILISYPLYSVSDANKKLGFLTGIVNFSEGLQPFLQKRPSPGGDILFYTSIVAPPQNDPAYTGPGSLVFSEKKGRALTEERVNVTAAQGGDPIFGDVHEIEHGVSEPIIRRLTGTDNAGTTIGIMAALVQVDSPKFILGPMNIVAEMEEAQALAWLGTLQYRATMTGIATLVVLLVVGLWISDMLSRPLGELARVANRIRNGFTDERLEPMRGAEAESVRQAFNQMLDDLEGKQGELVRTATLASVGELSSSIVHEIRNPLSSIKMNLQGLKRKVEGDAQYAELAQIATDQVLRVEGMLDDLLQYGRPVELHREATSFQEIADAVLEVVSEQADAKGIQIELNDGLLGKEFDVDREQLCRALTNLVNNAIQAVGERGTVVIVGGTDGLWSERAYIEVLDDGPGFTEESMDRLFKPFFTTKSDGTGLGLANVKKIVELHGGSVVAQNRLEGGGASVQMSLPARARG